MEEQVVEPFRTLLSIIPRETEFWSAIIGAVFGAVVGGLIAYMIQARALREARNQREVDHRRSQQALGHALLFKMVRIHSDVYHIHQHLEDCYQVAARRGEPAEPWQFILPIVNPPGPVHFSSDEMGMLLAQKNDDVFNLVIPMDVIHNSLSEAVKVLNSDRRALIERLTVENAEGTVVSGNLDS